MGELKATPGPWEYAAPHEVDISHGRATPIMYDPLINFIVKRTYRDEQGRRFTSFIAEANYILPEVSANARLIAAAPELYEALVQALDRMEMMADSKASGFIPACEAAIVSAKAAIAKAEGR